jgi:Holliday junction resolvase
MTHYRNGRDFEYKVRDELARDGYEMFRSAGSKTKIDLIAVKPGQLLFVQCKRTDPQISPDDRSRMLALAAMVGALPIVASKPIPRRPIQYRRLTGPGPKDWQPWTPDEVAL